MSNTKKTKQVLKETATGIPRAGPAGSTNQCQDAMKKKQALLEAKTLENKRKREAKMAAAAAAREAAERARREALEAARRERTMKEAQKNLQQNKNKQTIVGDAEKRRREPAASKKGGAEKCLKKIEQKPFTKRKDEIIPLTSEDNAAAMNLPSADGEAGRQVCTTHDFEAISDEDFALFIMAEPDWCDTEVQNWQLAVQRRVKKFADRLFRFRVRNVNFQEIFPRIEETKMKRTSSVIWNTPPAGPDGYQSGADAGGAESRRETLP